jgi:hypothetical protein
MATTRHERAGALAAAVDDLVMEWRGAEGRYQLQRPDGRDHLQDTTVSREQLPMTTVRASRRPASARRARHPSPVLDAWIR